MDWIRKDETGGDITPVLPLRMGEGFVVTGRQHSIIV